MRKRYIDPIKLKMSIAINNMSENPKSLEDVIDEEPDADVVEVAKCENASINYHEECVNCKNKNLCFLLLEYAGMTFRNGEKIMFNCEAIKQDTDYYQMQIERWIGCRP